MIPIHLPPLRERKEDIPALTQFFIEKYARAFGKEVQRISTYAMELLMDYPFPGNVRELENIIERSIALETSNIILPENLVLSGSASSQALPVIDIVIPSDGFLLNEVLAEIERRIIRKRS